MLAVSVENHFKYEESSFKTANYVLLSSELDISITDGLINQTQTKVDVNRQITFFQLIKQAVRSEEINRFACYLIKDGVIWRKFEFTLTNLIFNTEECKVATFRDLTEQLKLVKIQEDNRLLQMLTQSVTHEMVTPLKCVVELTTTT